MKKQSIGIGLMGLGVIGGQVAKVLTEKAAVLAEQAGCSLVLRKIKVLPTDLDRQQAREMPPELFTTDDDEFFAEPGIDIVVEAIGGENPAREYLKRAIIQWQICGYPQQGSNCQTWGGTTSFSAKT